MEGTYLCKCDSCGESFPRTEIRTLPFLDNTEINLCKKCDVRRFETARLPEKPRTDAVDIHKIIDDAMDKGDRSVYILIHSGGMSVTINPYVEEKTQWIMSEDGQFLTCSNCGLIVDNVYDSTYCPNCGEFMHGVRREKPTKNP